VKRIGPKASGRWQRISGRSVGYDCRTDPVLQRTIRSRVDRPGVWDRPGERSGDLPLRQPAGQPNVLTAGHFCYGPRIATSIITCGTNPIVDYANDPKCIMVWGNNLVISNPDCYKGEPFSVSLDKGAKLIAVDPRLTRIAARADVWLPLRPGTDAALAYAC